MAMSKDTISGLDGMLVEYAHALNEVEVLKAKLEQVTESNLRLRSVLAALALANGGMITLTHKDMDLIQGEIASLDYSITINGDMLIRVVMKEQE